MIPKVIHYCWFGRGELPKSAKKCIASWKKYCPNYEIKEWNEDNFDINSCDYTKEAYNAKKYAFVSDYARFHILYNNGGIYFDTDVELIKDITPLVKKGGFMGCEIDGLSDSQSVRNNISVNPGLGIAVAPGLGMFKEILDFYRTLHFLNEDGTLNTKTVVKYTTEILYKHGLQNITGIQQIEGVYIYPKEYFNPLNDNTGKLNITPNTYSIHWYSKTWMSKKEKIRSILTKPFHRLFGDDCFRRLRKK